MFTAMHVIIAVSSNSTTLEDTLDSLSACQFPKQYEGTIVVENGPSPSFGFLQSGHPRIPNLRYRHEATPGKSNALNTAVEMAGHGLLYFTDDDVRFAPETLQAYAEVAQSTNAPSYFGGPHDVTYDAPGPKWLLSYLPASARPRPENPVASKPEFTGFMGFNWAAYAAVVTVLWIFADDIRDAAEEAAD
jgi:glycosyltransferase involved in cell wall biosynthesis